MSSNKVSVLFQRFAEFYHFAHRNFIYDNVPVNKLALEKLQQLNDGRSTQRPSLARAIAVLNNGDCFVAALAVGEALTVMGYDVTYHSNGGHYFLSVLYVEQLVGPTGEAKPNPAFRVYHDTIYPLGKRAPEEMLRHPNPEIYIFDSGDAQWLVDRALENQLDIEFIEQFVGFYDHEYAFPYQVPSNVDRKKWYYDDN